MNRRLFLKTVLAVTTIGITKPLDLFKKKEITVDVNDIETGSTIEINTDGIFIYDKKEVIVEYSNKRLYMRNIKDNSLIEITF